VNFSKYTKVHICLKCQTTLAGCECFMPDIGAAYLVPMRDTPPNLPCYAGSETTSCDCTSYCGDDPAVPVLWNAIRKTHSKT